MIDGFTRDSKALISMKFPTFITGIQCQDSLGRVDVAELEVPIQCGGVAVRPRDLVLADFDGVVVVPVESADEVITLAEDKVAAENQMRARLANGAHVRGLRRISGPLRSIRVKIPGIEIHKVNIPFEAPLRWSGRVEYGSEPLRESNKRGRGDGLVRIGGTLGGTPTLMPLESPAAVFSRPGSLRPGENTLNASWVPFYHGTNGPPRYFGS